MLARYAPLTVAIFLVLCLANGAKALKTFRPKQEIKLLLDLTEKYGTYGIVCSRLAVFLWESKFCATRKFSIVTRVGLLAKTAPYVFPDIPPLSSNAATLSIIQGNRFKIVVGAPSKRGKYRLEVVCGTDNSPSPSQTFALSKMFAVENKPSNEKYVIAKKAKIYSISIPEDGGSDEDDMNASKLEDYQVRCHRQRSMGRYEAFKSLTSRPNRCPLCVDHRDFKFLTYDVLSTLRAIRKNMLERGLDREFASEADFEPDLGFERIDVVPGLQIDKIVLPVYQSLRSILLMKHEIRLARTMPKRIRHELWCLAVRIRYCLMGYVVCRNTPILRDFLIKAGNYNPAWKPAVAFILETSVENYLHYFRQPGVFIPTVMLFTAALFTYAALFMRVMVITERVTRKFPRGKFLNRFDRAPFAAPVDADN